MGEIDPELLALARDHISEGAVVWDIGANVGMFAFSAAHFAGRTGKVLAIEADPWLAALLRRSCSVRSGDDAMVEVLSVAVGQEPGIRAFRVSGRSRAASSLDGYGSTQAGKCAEMQTAMCVSLDWIAMHRDPPNVVKIDVEGAEAEVLHGATVLLSTVRPTLLCEVSSEHAGEVTEILARAGYVLFDGKQPFNRRTQIRQATWSTIALPSEIVSTDVKLT